MLLLEPMVVGSFRSQYHLIRITSDLSLLFQITLLIEIKIFTTYNKEEGQSFRPALFGDSNL